MSKQRRVRTGRCVYDELSRVYVYINSTSRIRKSLQLTDTIKMCVESTNLLSTTIQGISASTDIGIDNRASCYAYYRK